MTKGAGGEDAGATDGIDLFWIPLGADGWLVQRSGRLYEAYMARRERRRPLPLFHSALVVTAAAHSWVVEMAPVWSLPEPERGVVVEGPVASRQLGRWRMFRYEVRCWPGGRIPDADKAVDSPVRLSDDTSLAQDALALVPDVPPLVWGRDELGVGDMWNSNSLTSWVLARIGLDAAGQTPPSGRAPGWNAGIHLAARGRLSSQLETGTRREP